MIKEATIFMLKVVSVLCYPIGIIRLQKSFYYIIDKLEGKHEKAKKKGSR